MTYIATQRWELLPLPAEPEPEPTPAPEPESKPAPNPEPEPAPNPASDNGKYNSHQTVVSEQSKNRKALYDTGLFCLCF